MSITFSAEFYGNLTDFWRNFERKVLLGGLPPHQTPRNWFENRPPKNARLGSQMAVKSVISTLQKNYGGGPFISVPGGIHRVKVYNAMKFGANVGRKN